MRFLVYFWLIELNKLAFFENNCIVRAMEMIRNILIIPREILNDFRTVFSSTNDFIASFARGYVAFAIEIYEDLKTVLSPFFARTIYRSIFDDFAFVLTSISAYARTLWQVTNTTSEDMSPKKTSITPAVVANTTAAPIRQKIEAAYEPKSGTLGFLYNFFMKYRILLIDIYEDIKNSAEETDEIPMYLIAAAILVFMLGCVWFYVIMVFGV